MTGNESDHASPKETPVPRGEGLDPAAVITAAAFELLQSADFPTACRRVFAVHGAGAGILRAWAYSLDAGGDIACTARRLWQFGPDGFETDEADAAQVSQPIPRTLFDACVGSALFAFPIDTPAARSLVPAQGAVWCAPVADGNQCRMLLCMEVADAETDWPSRWGVCAIPIARLLYYGWTRWSGARKRERLKTLEAEIARRGIIQSLQEAAQIREELHSANELLERRNRELIFANEAARESARLKSEFLANISHELRTPLNAILGFLNIYLADTDVGEEEKQECVRTARDSAAQLLEMINKVIEIANVESGKISAAPMEYPLAFLLEEISTRFAPAIKEKALGWTLRLPEDIELTVYANPPKLRDALTHLVDNAVKFTNEGGIELTAATVANGDIRIDIRDTGVGFDPSRLEDMFRPFSQGESGTNRRYGGAGLGLAISKKLLELMGGTLRLVSDGANKGTTAIVTIPTAAAAAPAPQPRPVAVESRSRVLSHEDSLVVVTVGVEEKLRAKMSEKADPVEISFRAGEGVPPTLDGMSMRIGIVDALVIDLDSTHGPRWLDVAVKAARVPAVLITSWNRGEIDERLSILDDPLILTVVQRDRVRDDPTPILRALSKQRRRQIAAKSETAD